MVPTGSAGIGSYAGLITSSAVVVDDGDERVRVGSWAVVEWEVKARAWKREGKVTSRKMRLGYFARRALHRRRQLNSRVGVIAFGVVGEVR